MSGIYANLTEETATGTDSTISLAGATTGNIVFSKSFADGQLVAYVIDDSGGTIRVAGVGTYVSSGNSITRDDTWNFNGTNVDENPSTNITLSGDTHTIRCAEINNQLLQVRTDYVNARAANQFVVDAWSKGTSTTRTGIADRLWMTPFCVVAPVTLASLGIDITALSASLGDMEIGLYNMDFNDNSFTLIDKTGTIDTNTATGSTGYNTSSLAGGNLTLLPNTPYFIVVGSDGTATMRGIDHSVGGHPYAVILDEFKAVGQFEVGGWVSGLPSTISAQNQNGTQVDATYPAAFGVKA